MQTLIQIYESQSCSRNNIDQQYGKLNQCIFVNKNCQHLSTTIDFVSLYYCTFSQNLLILITLGSLLIFFSFHLLASTAENYLTPSVIRIAKYLDLSDSVAGVTLLALANGAPDVITSFSAGASQSEGLRLAVGSIFGASLCVCCLITGIIIWQANVFIVNKTIKRDVLFYLSSTILLIVFGFFDCINFAFAISFTCIYIFYIILVFYESKQEREALPIISSDQVVSRYKMEEEMVELCFDKKNQLQAMQLEEDLQALSLRSTYQKINLEQQFLQQKPKDVQIHGFLNSLQQEGDNYVSDNNQFNIKNAQNQRNAQLNEPLFQHNYEQSRAPATLRLRSYFGLLKIKHKLKQGIYKVSDDWQNAHGFCGKFMYLYEQPLNFIRNYTVPCVDEESWFKHRAIGYPLLSSVFALLATNGLDSNVFGVNVVWLIIPFGIILGFIIFKYTDANNPPKFLIVFTVFSFLMSILWIYYSANILLDFIYLIQLISEANETLIGVTLVAFGNCAGDFFAIKSLAKKGLGLMAMSGIYSGQLFNLLIGFGSTLIRTFLNQNDLNFSLSYKMGTKKQVIMVYIVLIAIFLCLIFTFCMFMFAKKVSKVFATFLFVLYGMMIIALLISNLVMDNES